MYQNLIDSDDKKREKQEFLKNKQRLIDSTERWGSFWGLYFFGIAHILDLKWSIAQQSIQLVFDFAISMIVTRIIVDKPNEHSIPMLLIVLYSIKKANPIISYLFARPVLEERMRISLYISSFIDELYKSA